MTKKTTALFLAIFGVFLFGLAVQPPAFAGSGYLDAVDDMPLMEGLQETGDGGIVFDKPTGRIVRSVTRGDVTPAAVRSFYIEALPQLGWTRTEKLELIDGLLLFRRENEQLEIQIVPLSRGSTEVRFSIVPV